MDSRDLLLQRSREAGIEILTLFGRISRLTARARRAAARGRTEGLERILDRRQLLFVEAAAEVRRLAALLRDLPVHEASHVPPMLARVGDAARRVQAENDELAAKLARQRDRAVEAITRSNAASRAASAYRPASRSTHLDLTR